MKIKKKNKKNVFARVLCNVSVIVARQPRRRRNAVSKNREDYIIVSNGIVEEAFRICTCARHSYIITIKKKIYIK